MDTRQVVLDTETTGLDPADGHRIIEIGCVEMINRRVTDRTLQFYLNPQRAIDAGATRVHGITNDFLRDKPAFADILAEFLAFIKGSELIVHNAPFDVGFLNMEFKRVSATLGVVTDYAKVIDTLALARQKHPGQKNNLDALCKRYEIGNDHRQLHGALLDAQILAAVYLAMTRGQSSLLETTHDAGGALAMPSHQSAPALQAIPDNLRVVRASEEDECAHSAFLSEIKKRAKSCIWTDE